MAPITAPLLGVLFFKGSFSLKNGTKKFYWWDTVRLRSMEHIFSITYNTQKLLCMGHTYTANWGNNNNLEEDCLEYLCLLQEMVLSMCLRNNF